MDAIRNSMLNLELTPSDEQSINREQGANRQREHDESVEPAAKRRVLNSISSMAAPPVAQPRLSGPQREERTIPSQSMPPFNGTLNVTESSGSISEVSMPSFNSGLDEQSSHLARGSTSSASQNRRRPTTAEDLQRLHAILNNKWETIKKADVITVEQATETLDLTAKIYFRNIRRFCYSMSGKRYPLVADPKYKAGIELLCKQAVVLSYLKERVAQEKSDALMANQLIRLKEQEQPLSGKMRDLYCFLWGELFVSLDSLAGQAHSFDMQKKEGRRVNAEGLESSTRRCPRDMLESSIDDCQGVLELAKTLKTNMPRAAIPSDEYLSDYIKSCKDAIGTNHCIGLPEPLSKLFDRADEDLAVAKLLLEQSNVLKKG